VLANVNSLTFSSLFLTFCYTPGIHTERKETQIKGELYTHIPAHTCRHTHRTSPFEVTEVKYIQEFFVPQKEILSALLVPCLFEAM
jgi:hypothetical protein